MSLPAALLNTSFAVITFGRELVVEDDRAEVLQHLGQRVEEGDRLRPRREEADRIEDRSRVEEEREAELPDLGDVTKPDEERRQQERDAEREDVELEQERHEQ